jgi:hypothetical protein
MGFPAVGNHGGDSGDWGHIFVGRTKEGFSLNKVMIGYGGWTNERAQSTTRCCQYLLTA